MSVLSDEKLIKLTKMGSQGGFWYITKQNLKFRDLCYMAKILESWGDRADENYQNYFDRHKTMPEYGSLDLQTPHRATRNCEYIGLIDMSDNGKYSSRLLTPFYFSLKEICDGNFNNLEHYPSIINKQLEKIYISSNNAGNKINFNICPFMFLFKILILIGDITKSYKITVTEFKLFVATAHEWNDYLEVVDSILRYRKDLVFKGDCDKNLEKVSDVRYNILAQNHSQLIVTNNEISIVESECQTVRKKVYEYELRDRIQTSKDVYSSIDVQSHQQIFYGAPGTGKSHIINEVTEVQPKDNVFRTTFHPDSDYSTFVGTYKPTMNRTTITDDNGQSLNQGANKLCKEQIVYKFVPQAFLKAYIRAWNAPEEKVYLIIEEINRGNCAQIFGDLFQLLDRKNGESVYHIKADDDLCRFLRDGKDDSGSDILVNKAGIADGELCLPNNLYIWATMNTSDQSLFPIDSAFKRRWDWIYVRISEGRDKKTKLPLNYRITVNNIDYDWWSFITKINNRIGSITSSEDKKLGYFFCYASDGIISAEMFVNKVCFYLWNDVFKNFGFGKQEQSIAFKKDDGKIIAFDDFYIEDSSTFKTVVNENLLESLLKKLEVKTYED